MRTFLAAALCGLLLLPAASADDATTPLGITIGVLNDPIPYQGNASLPVTIEVGCQHVLAAALGSQSTTVKVTVAVDDPPSWLTAPAIELSLNPANCASATPFLTQSGLVELKVDASAPGVERQFVNLTATMPAAPGGTPMTATERGDFNVSYYAAHTITPSLTFPHTMTGRTLNFTVTVTVNANARSMVMFENVKATPGSFGGLSSDFYNPPETKVFNVTYRAPEGAWTQANITMFAFSHFLIESSAQAGGPNLAENLTWAIVNGNPDGGDGTKDAPIGGAPLVAALALSALLASRRKK
jgi:hypothetical protein